MDGTAGFRIATEIKQSGACVWVDELVNGWVVEPVLGLLTSIQNIENDYLHEN